MDNNLLSKAVGLIRSGEKNEGRKILVELVKANPSNEMAWLWLSACAGGATEKILCLDKVVQINPSNEKAKAALLKLRHSVSGPDLDDIVNGPQSTKEIPYQIDQLIKNPRSVQFIPANCPNCGGELRVPQDKSIVKCMYCGHDVIIHDPNKIDVNLQLKVDITKPLRLARAAEEGNNFEDGYKYYSQVLEQDSENAVAWLGRARCAAWRGTVKSPTLDEAISYIKTAAALQTQDREDFRKTIITIAKSTTAFTQLVADYVNADYGNRNPKMQVPDALIAMAVNAQRNRLIKEIGETFLSVYLTSIRKTYEFCWKQVPSEEVGASIYQSLSIMRKILIFNDEINQNIEATCQKLVEEVGEKYPDLPKPEKRESCYIATATMGNIEHPYVETLRQFRDQILARSFIGRQFIIFYYRSSPLLATKIASSNILRKLSLVLIVKPLYLIARKSLVQ